MDRDAPAFSSLDSEQEMFTMYGVSVFFLEKYLFLTVPDDKCCSCSLHDAAYPEGGSLTVFISQGWRILPRPGLAGRAGTLGAVSSLSEEGMTYNN